MKLYHTLLWCLVVVAACHTKAVKPREKERHMVEVKYTNGCQLYVDEVDSRQVINRDNGDTSQTIFRSYKVGISDSIRYNKEEEEAWGKYFNYTMEKEWVAVVNGDSTHAVFFQPTVARQQQAKEGILVFELPAGTHPDTLVYNSSYPPYYKQLIVFNSNK